MSSAVATPEPSINSLPLAMAAGVLVVSPNDDLRVSLMSRLSSRWIVQQAVSGADALEKISTCEPAVVLVDPCLPDLRADEFCDFLKLRHSQVEVIGLNAHTGRPIVDTPSFNAMSVDVIREIERGGPLVARATAPAFRFHGEERRGLLLPGFVGSAPSIRRLAGLVKLVAQRETTVLVTGESGTGKDLVARAFHELSPRRLKPFAVINCAAIPEPLLEAELFGFVKGAFTGAVHSRIGRIHAAQGGTLFLDEIGDLPLGLQSKLLRFLEQGEVQRLGSSDTFRVDVRVITATNADLRRRVQERNFREDLYYRLSVFPIELPPLRERKEDLPALIQHFLSKFSSQQVNLTADALTVLQQHQWPGNVRELRNVIERASILSAEDREIRPEHVVL